MSAHYIKEWRKHRGMTQAQLAQAMSISRPYLTMIERGDRRYDQTFLEAASTVLECTPADLISREPNKTESIAKLLEPLDDQERNRIEAAIRALLGHSDG